MGGVGRMRCKRRLERLEGLVWELLQAHDQGEMGTFQAALEKLRRYMNRR